MLDMLARNWWLFAIRGIAAIVFGVLAFLWPGLTVVVLVALFGAYAIVDGVSLLISLVRGEPNARRHGWTVGIMGVIGVIAGIVAFWSIVLGVFQVIAAIRLRREIEGELWLGIGGVIAILFGLYLAIFPGSGLLSLVWLVAIWSIVFGIANLLLAFRLRGHTGYRTTATA